MKDLYTGRTYVGHGTHVDVVEASGEAYLDAVNRLFGARDADEAAALARGESYTYTGPTPARASA